jgi:hypothetical protein
MREDIFPIQALISAVLIALLMLLMSHTKVPGILLMLFSIAFIVSYLVVYWLWWRLILRTAYVWCWRYIGKRTGRG